ncbi:hypothetical protein L484_007397 [Morus notabilis]|uniref:Methyltransferase domain-containing protein n=1 Tax=Morus notabilis TaxID=981085 RepID=W9QXS1_9ROSA|nr:hypothetical protein L484_007397 [Morus notabilis]
MAEKDCCYSCSSASETLRWISAVVEFLNTYSFFRDAHLVNFFRDKLWESLDSDWIECLGKEPVEILLQIPSGLVKHDWPPSLKHFLLTLNSLVFPRQHSHSLQTVLPEWLNLNMEKKIKITSVNGVLGQGMNPKKKHEVEILSALLSCVAHSVGAHTIIDVGAGQGYLSQVLSFQYNHSVLAIDASSHHGSVTNARAQRIYKHYAFLMRKSKSEKTSLMVPKTITCRVMSIDMLKDLITSEATTCSKDNGSEQHRDDYGDMGLQQSLCRVNDDTSSMLLAGLHACGDLSSAERWRCLEADDGIHNFELHAFRAAFQMILKKYYPEVMISSPSIGRQGKALRRRQKRETLESVPCHKDSTCASSSHIQSRMEDNCPPVKSTEPETGDRSSSGFETASSLFRDSRKGDKYSLFQRYSLSGLRRLGLKPLQDIDFCRIWDEVEPFSEMIGPYWSLRAALGPLLETFILLDRLLFLQEAGNSIEAMMLPIFDPELSPRNVAIIAKKI